MLGPKSPLRRRRTTFLAAGTLASCLAAPAAALAQGPGPAGQLSCSAAEKQSLDTADKQVIRQFAEQQAAALAGTDAAASSKARDALLAPLACPNVSVVFRMEYSQALEGALARLAPGPDERVAVNALRILGRLKTTSAEKPIAAALRSNSPVVRFAAASAYRELLGLIAQDSFGFDRAVDPMLDGLGAALQGETDPMVAEGIVLALDGARANPQLRTRAMTRLCDGLTALLKRLRARPADSAPWTPVALRAADAVRLTLFEQLPAGNVDREFARRAAESGGHVLALARDLLANPAFGSEPARLEQGSGMVGACEGLLVFAHNYLTNSRVGQFGLAATFKRAATDGRPDGFTTSIAPWIGENGYLTKDPYKTRPADFSPVK